MRSHDSLLEPEHLRELAAVLSEARQRALWTIVDSSEGRTPLSPSERTTLGIGIIYTIDRWRDRYKHHVSFSRLGAELPSSTALSIAAFIVESLNASAHRCWYFCSTEGVGHVRIEVPATTHDDFAHAPLDEPEATDLPQAADVLVRWAKEDLAARQVTEFTLDTPDRPRHFLALNVDLLEASEIVDECWPLALAILRWRSIRGDECFGVLVDIEVSESSEPEVDAILHAEVEDRTSDLAVALAGLEDFTVSYSSDHQWSMVPLGTDDVLGTSSD